MKCFEALFGWNCTWYSLPNWAWRWLANKNCTFSVWKIIWLCSHKRRRIEWFAKRTGLDKYSTNGNHARSCRRLFWGLSVYYSLKGLCRGQILVLKEALGTMKPHYRTNHPGKFLVHYWLHILHFIAKPWNDIGNSRKEYIATLNSAISKYRMIVVISEHLVSKDKYRTRDGYLNLDPYCSGRFPK